jgi:hypothetical protein
VAGDVAKEGVFVEHADADQGGVGGPGEAGVGVLVGEEFSGKCGPGGESGFGDGDEVLDFHFDALAEVRDFGGGKAAHRVHVDVDVEAAFFESGKEVVDAVELGGVEVVTGGGVAFLLVDEFAVVVVEADGVVAGAGKAVGEGIGLGAGWEVGVEAEVDAVKADAPSGAAGVFEMS